jgi:hypothetical protein
LRVARGAGCLYSLGCLEEVFSETGLPVSSQAVELVAVGPVGSPKHLKPRPKDYKTGVFSP